MVMNGFIWDETSVYLSSLFQYLNRLYKEFLFNVLSPIINALLKWSSFPVVIPYSFGGLLQSSDHT